MAGYHWRRNEYPWALKSTKLKGGAYINGVQIGPGATPKGQDTSNQVHTFIEGEKFRRTVNPDARLSGQLSVQRSRETQDCPFGRSVIDQTRMSLERVDRVVEHDCRLPRRTLLQVRNSLSGKIEEGVNVGVEGVEPLFRRKFGDLSNRVLIAVIADESVELTVKVVQVLLNDGLAHIFLGQISSEELELARVVRLLADEVRGLLDVLLLLGEVGDRQVCSL